MNKPTARTRVVRCQVCDVTKPMQLHKNKGNDGGHLTPEVVQTFEADGWLFGGRSRGLCPDHNLLKDM